MLVREMDRDWLIIPQSEKKNTDSYTTLLDFMKYVESERGQRYTQGQADTLEALVKNLIETIRASKNKDKH